MKQVQVSVPSRQKSKAEEVLEDYSSDLSNSEVEKDDKKFVEFTATVESEDIDEMSEELKSLENIDSGELSIRVIKQESLIRKGQKTRGSDSMLSQAELYSKAQEASEFNKAQWGLIALSSIIATYGLVSDNLIVVIGAMMLAPILSPFISGALSLNVGDRKLMFNSLKTGAASIVVAVFFSFLAALPFPVTGNATLALVSQPSIISILLSVFVGAAAALTFATGLRDQIAGVAVAIALVPPIASVGIGLKTMDSALLFNSSMVAGMNMLAVLISGFACFHIMGLKPSTYYKKKQAEKIKYILPAAFIIFGLLALPVAYSSYHTYQDYLMEENIQKEAEDFFGDSLLYSQVDGPEATFYVVGDVNETAFSHRVTDRFDLKVVELQQTN